MFKSANFKIFSLSLSLLAVSSLSFAAETYSAMEGATAATAKPISSQNTPVTETLIKAIDALQSNYLTQAYELLDQIPMDAPEYQIAFLEMQKVHYRTKNWDKFFGYATFYRKNMLKAAPNVHLMLLEILALSKHCQYDNAEKIFEAAKPYVTQDYLTQFQAIADILNLQRMLEGHVRTAPVKAPFAVLTPTVHWLIPQSQRETIMSGVIKNPRALRIVVKSSCKDQNSNEEISAELNDIQIASGGAQ